MAEILPEDLAGFIQSEVKAGRYVDEAEVVRDAVLRLADAREQADAIQLNALRAALQPGLEDVQEGRFAAGGVMDAAARAAACPDSARR